MRSIQYYLPNSRHTEINRIYVLAKPAQAWEAVRHFDAGAIPWIRLLFDIRTLPGRILGRHEMVDDRRIGIDQIAANAKGFMIVHETPGKDVVVGAIGKFWQLDIPFASVKPGEFVSFEEPGWGKLAWAIVVEPYMDGSTISLELRTTATDDQSWKKLKHYYRFIGLGSRPIRHSLMKHYETGLGKMKLPNIDKMILPGDEIIADAKYAYTHSARVEAPVTIVWRYLMQLGCDRAGWYSVDLLDNGGISSVDHLIDGWEDRKVGERIAANPGQDAYFDVYAVEKEKYLTLGGGGHRFAGDFKMTWTFALDPIGDDATRLIARVRMRATPAWSEWLQGTLLAPPIHGLMQSVQLKTIRQLAERDARARSSEIEILNNAFAIATHL